MDRMVPTRSVRAATDYKDLESFFKDTDEDVETFVDALMRETTEDSRVDVASVRKLAQGKPDRVTTPHRFSESLCGFVRLFHGWHNDDYVWHVEHAAIRRPWKVPVPRVIYIIAKTMHEILPDIEADIWPPQADWELKTVTFKALGLKNEWSFKEDMIEKINSKLFAALNMVV